ncbi:MAG: F0F1 ATP synthase subunit gamma [Azonexaceae bacterium]|uniref:F0F1 ATP synthase subunit gamma n=1 Tax=Azonexus sp. R2A61 TaxID=2744443 RepID=UPI001F2E9FCB|nr:F0F1 ATP synthase subunit gamma [Azonexus sp. R2A61]MCE1238852.1 F0F1 ATP synthase subunit gamma [Azonexaceae bacterium]
MPSGKEIRNKIKSVENTRKITKAMEMVAASKMRKAQDRMRAARPYGEKIRRVASNLSHALTEYKHPFLEKREPKAVGIVLVTSDKGLCGGLNSNVLRLVLGKMKEFDSQQIKFQATCVGNKGLGFMQRAGAKIVSHVVALGDTPHLEKLIGPLKVQLDAYMKGEIDALYIGYTRFINTMKQEPVFEKLLPLADDVVKTDHQPGWDYVYEPEAQPVIDDLLLRYVEALIYQAVAENMASEQSARMVAMKSASDNAKNVIGELKLVYNKARQAAITKELSEIVSGAAAV